MRMSSYEMGPIQQRLEQMIGDRVAVNIGSGHAGPGIAGFSKVVVGDISADEHEGEVEALTASFNDATGNEVATLSIENGCLTEAPTVSPDMVAVNLGEVIFEIVALD
jgi:hypothetical protein